MRLTMRLTCALVLSAAAALAQPAPGAVPAALSDAERERFLLEAELVRTKGVPEGVTGTLRAMLRRGELTHDASIQTIDEAKARKEIGSTVEIDFRDSYKNNVAAYRLDRLLGLGMIPVTVERAHGTRSASFTWWVDDVLMTEKDRFRKKAQPTDPAGWTRQIWVVRVFDQLISNFDRNLGNLVIDGQWRVWMIDHTRAFKIFKELRSPKSLAEWCERDLLAALRALDKPRLRAATEGLLTEAQVDGVLGRRDLIVAHYDRLLAERGDSRVLYDLPSRLP
jgi:hypothetical protein